MALLRFPQVLRVLSIQPSPLETTDVVDQIEVLVTAEQRHAMLANESCDPAVVRRNRRSRLPQLAAHACVVRQSRHVRTEDCGVLHNACSQSCSSFFNREWAIP